MRADAITLGATAAPAPLFARQLADQAPGAGTTYTNATDLFAAVAIGTYTFKAVLRGVAATADDLNLRWTVPAGTTYFAAAMDQDAGLAFNPQTIISTGTPTSAVTVGGQGLATPVSWVLEGTFIVTTAGTVQLQFAAAGGSGSPTLHAGSYIALQKVA